MATKLQTISQLKGLQNKRVLVRVDINVPTKNGKVTDTTRMQKIKPTIDELKKKGAQIILAAHFGRPKKQEKEFDMKVLVKPLAKVLEADIGFAKEIKKEEIKNNKITLLQNTRFYDGETKNHKAFAKKLASLADVYVNDAFSAAHRAHASTEGVTKLLPAYAGNAVAEEIKMLDSVLKSPKKPVVAIVGGAKVSTKIDLLNNLIKKMDYLVIGGAMANTFVLANGCDTKKSLVEEKLLGVAKNIIRTAKKYKCEIVLPEDVVVASGFKGKASVCMVDNVPDNKMILDLGPKTVKRINEIVGKSKTLIWNGPLGAFETKPFDKATNQVAKEVAKRTSAKKIISVAGGGDTVAALNNAKATKKFSYVSTAGGAFLEWVEGKKLPGLLPLYKPKK